MKTKTLMSLQPILLINWVIVPILAVMVWVNVGFSYCIGFVISWLIADWIWDKITHLFMSFASPRDDLAVALNIEEVPLALAFLMVIDLLGALVMPWIVKIFFLSF